MENVKIFASCHNHSNFSDAEYSPEKLVEIAHELGHGGFILTDHDTVKGTYFTNKACRKLGMKSILGCEFSTYHGNVGVHLLGFDFNPDNSKMAELLAYGSGVQTRRSEVLFNMGLERGTLRQGITWQDVRDDFPYNDYLCVDQVFTSMVKRGIYTLEEYDEFRMPNFSYKLGLEDKVKEITGMSYRNISTERAIKTILEAGGVPVVAHPHGLMRFAEEFLDMGVMGFETRFPFSDEKDFDFFENICNERGLYKMGGSDHSGILGGPGRDLEVCPYEQSGITEEDFMMIYERKLG
jgi:predicted metal-dependent phosphoesterase TrpH